LGDFGIFFTTWWPTSISAFFIFSQLFCSQFVLLVKIFLTSPTFYFFYYFRTFKLKMLRVHVNFLVDENSKGKSFSVHKVASLPSQRRNLKKRNFVKRRKTKRVFSSTQRKFFPSTFSRSSDLPASCRTSSPSSSPQSVDDQDAAEPIVWPSHVQDMIEEFSIDTYGSNIHTRNPDFQRALLQLLCPSS
jgi:hypothetical protein